MKIDGILDTINISDIGNVGSSFDAIVDAFNFRDVRDVIDDDGFAWRFNNFLHKICVRAFINYLPCICASVKYLNCAERKINKKKANKQNI